MSSNGSMILERGMCNNTHLFDFTSITTEISDVD